MTVTINRKNDCPALIDLLPAMPDKVQNWHCFASPETLAEYLHSVRRGQYWERTGISHEADRWMGHVTFDQALRMVSEGWQEGAERVARLRGKIAVYLPLKRRLGQFHVAGALVDVPKYLGGNPQCMKRPAQRVNRARPILTLVNHMGGNTSVPAECFVNRCAVVAAIVDAIEANGYSCHVIGLNMSHVPSLLTSIVTTLKEPGDVPDLAKLAFALGHVGFFRRLSFAVRGSDRDDRPLGGSLGSTCDFPALDVPNVFVLPSMNTTEYAFSSEKAAETRGLETMLEALRTQDCPAFPREEIAA